MLVVKSSPAFITLVLSSALRRVHTCYWLFFIMSMFFRIPFIHTNVQQLNVTSLNLLALSDVDKSKVSRNVSEANNTHVKHQRFQRIWMAWEMKLLLLILPLFTFSHR